MAAAGTTRDPPLLDVTNLTASFRINGEMTPVVREVSFSVGARETVAIVGGSGSGKSVTAMSIMRLLPPRSSSISGRVALSGENLLAASEARMQAIRGNDITMIFQEPMTSLNPVLTIGFQVSEALIRHRGMSRKEAAAETVRLLEKVRIPSAKSRFHDYPHRLSGGMRQRVMIAMALACQPKLLIADEPTTALDVTIQAQTLELIRVLQEEEGMSVLFITHDMGVVAEIADRTIVMHEGRIVETGTTVDLFEAPRHPYTRALLAAVPDPGAMRGHRLPMRFPLVDIRTGEVEDPVELPDTVTREGAPILEVSNLTVRFDVRGGLGGGAAGRIHAVENVSLSVQPGETLALVGESGCGKSTIGRSILRLNTPQAGTILLGGASVLEADPAELRKMRRRVQMVFQDPFASLNPRIRIGDALMTPLLVHGLADRKRAPEIVARLLRQVSLSPDMMQRYPHEFSGGQRQRICIARALALEPNLIVADEAVSALDVSVKTQIINLMLDLQERLKLSYLFISHDMAVVERVAHRVAVMYLGEIVETGDRADVFGNPQHPYTQKLLAAVPVADPRVKRQRELSSDEIKSPMRPLDFVPPPRSYREVSPGHFVQV